MTLKDLFTAEKIPLFSALPLSECRITKERLISDAEAENLYAVMLVIPYPFTAKKSLFASFSVIRDYHLYIKELSEKVIPYLTEKYGTIYAKLFADHSPIDERLAACRTGLGIIGDNGLFITKKHGSFVFIGELITDLTAEQLHDEGIVVHVEEIKGCIHCGNCEKACPSHAIGKDKSQCVSNLTQKKGLLTDTECDIIRSSGYVWGCDKCALACPYNRTIEGQYNPFFLEKRLKITSFEDVERLTEEEYAQYPFSWRKKDIIKRNFEIYESDK